MRFYFVYSKLNKVNNKKILITGINGFVGEHVAREFKNQGHFVIGVGHSDTPNEKVRDLINEYINCNLLDETQVNEKLDLSEVAAIIHLAGLGSVGESFQIPRRYITENGLIAYNILQRAADTSMPGRIIVVSTGALYDPSQPLPLSEDAITSPNSPYAVGKLMTEDVTKYFRKRGVDAVIARPFNHIGPGQSTSFILPDFYEQLLASQDSGKMLVGNIETRRDYTDVRDIAHAYGMIALAPSLKHDTYNICSGRSLSGRQILEIIKESVPTSGDVMIEVDQTKIRPNDIMDIVGNSTRLQEELGWSPAYAIDQTIKDFISAK